MSVRPKKTGSSKLMRDKQRLEQEAGPLARDGQNWTQQEDDHLLDLYFAGHGLKTIAVNLQRPLETIENRVWKLATGYRKCGRYQPVDRLKPRRTQLSRREIEVLQLGLFGEGQSITNDRRVPVDAEHMARVLNRSLAAVQRYIDKRKPQTKGFF